MTLEEFDKKYTRQQKPSLLLRLMGDRTKEEQSMRPTVVEHYRKVREKYGDLFEKVIRPIEPEEEETIRKRKQRALRRVYIFAGLIVLIIVFFSAIEPPEVRRLGPLEIFELLLLVGGTLGYWYLTKRNFDRILESKEKEVIKAVITDKVRSTERRDSDEGALFFELSLQEMVQVWSEDYKKFTLGDSIQIEIISDDILVKRKVFKTGELPQI